MKKRIYIAGKVTGLTEPEVRVKFNNAAHILRNMGFIAVNPVDIVNDHNCLWETAMRKCIAEMMTADAVLALPCCGKSRGARIELQLCADIEIPVFGTYNDILKHFGKYPSIFCEHPKNRRANRLISSNAGCETTAVTCQDCSKVLEEIIDC